MGKQAHKDIINSFQLKAEEALSHIKFLEINGARLYFLNKEANDFFRQLRESFIDHEACKSERQFASIVNLLNPEAPSYSYSTGIRAKYKQVLNQEKVKGRLEGEFEIWKNTKLKNANEYIGLHSLSDSAADNIEKEVLAEIEVAKSELKYILKNFDDLEVKLTTFEHRKAYPYVKYYIDNDGKPKAFYRHLSIVAPNALFYVPRTYRVDMEIEEFVRHAKNPFGPIYYMERDK